MNGLPQWFMSLRQMELHVLMVIMPLLSTPVSRPSVSNSSPGGCLLEIAGWTTFH